MSRFWGPNIVIDGSVIREEFEDPLPTSPPTIVRRETTADHAPHYEAPAYEFQTQEVIRQIARTAVGGILIQQINSSPHTLTIRALNPRASLDQTQTDWDPPTPAGRQAASRGGGGSNVTIWYESTAWKTPSVKIEIDPFDHYASDDVLFHEMVHALRMMRGLMDPTKIIGWDNIEDLFAIMLTNTYNSSNNRNNDLRGDHAEVYHSLGNSLLRPTEQMSDQAFYIQYGSDIDRLWRSLPCLCDRIARVGCKWNPLRARVNVMNNRIFPVPTDGTIPQCVEPKLQNAS
jgi:hypothetical protein